MIPRCRSLQKLSTRSSIWGLGKTSPDIGYLVIALVTTPRFFRQNNMDFRGGVGFVSWQATLKLDTSARLNGSLVRQDRNISGWYFYTQNKKKRSRLPLHCTESLNWTTCLNVGWQGIYSEPFKHLLWPSKMGVANRVHRLGVTWALPELIELVGGASPLTPIGQLPIST